ncbi:sestrin-1 isoform X3 [Panthera tigris]|uniref:sestrin-1 isoform X3 n=1 Tax=Panthera leo TaxID=9689 RepID=UPI001C6A5A1A|nr:sestrin-1 isoform X3 [Panthera leo]XP_042842882.1 sestrin-1 isoform X3 [Panthera tigris]XP_049510073.1 sestrin-1 isoform X3 [Panthera uncia]
MAEGENEVRWDGLCSRDSTTRETALENIRQTILRRTEYLRSVKETPFRPSDGLSNAVSLDGLNKLLAHLLMLSKRCPFKDVREKSEFILKSVQELGIRIPRPLGHGPSRFIPEKEILQVGSEDAQMHALFADSFAALGRLDNITLVMVFHPQYLESFLKTQHYLLQMDGPLPLHYRHYIGIMAAARHQCSYLVNLHVNDFLHVGGDPKWLNGLENAPQKLQNLGELNKVLAHRPWLITKEHIEVSDSFFEVEALMEKMRQLQECRDEEEASQEEMASRFEIEKRESMFVFSSDDEEVTPARDVSRHFEDTSYGYKDFSRHGMHVPTFRVQDYCWEDHGYSLVNRLYPDVGQLIDEKFHIAYNLTYNTMAMHKDVDTSMLRRAIWNYIHCMFGIRYDDYDYGEINQLLDRSFKVYIKTVVCTPEKVTKRMYDSFWRQFKHSEKVHVNLLLIEARMQAELLYALRAITRYMT